MDKSSSNIEMLENTSKENNSLQKNMEEISLKNPTLSTIPKITTKISEMNTIQNVMEIMKYLKIAYPNKDEIPLIKIRNEDFFESGERIEDYINNLGKFDDTKFDLCLICKERLNEYFCKNCNKNICDNCSEICKLNNHILIYLFDELNKITKYIKIIKAIFIKNFILPKKKKEYDEIMKKTNYFYFIDECEMNNEILEKPMDYTYDIRLIEAIIDKNYINFFHYRNVEECYNYIIKKSSINSINEISYIQKNSESKIDAIDIEEESAEINDCITLRYIIKYGVRKIKIFGKEFMERNKNNCKIIYETKKYDLTEYFILNNTKEINILEIILTGISNIDDDISYMFCGCSSLIKFPYISEWNINKIKEMRGMFSGCSSLISLPDISKWKTYNVKDISYMFSGCSSLISLPDISKWKTDNVENMSYLFSGCSKLISLPDISKWNTYNVKKLNYIFKDCSSLKYLPDISKWNINNIAEMTRIFSGCSKLKYLPDISKWNIYNNEYMSGIFFGCSKLISLPDISKWKTDNVKDMSYMFSGCSSLISLPDISKWKTDNVNRMSYMFSGCSHLITLPDISKWNTDNVKNKKNIF